MDHLGIDVHKRESQICILVDGGDPIERRIATSRERFAAMLGGRPKAKILIEASTESEWVARCLEELGHEVIVADPNFSPMYATRSRRVKTDRRDARTLAEACRLGAYRPAHRTSPAQRHVRAQLAVRESLVRTRAKYISLGRALLRREGIRVADGQAESFAKRVEKLALPEFLKQQLSSLLAMMQPLNEQIAHLDDALEKLASEDDRVRRLCTVPSVGPVTAAAFVSLVDDPARFKGPHQVQAYLGLVPSEQSSGEKQNKGRITKTGNPRMRALLVQVAQSMLRLRRASTLHLREWAERIAARRGKKIAIVALARRIAGVLFAILRDGTVYRPTGATAVQSQAA
jgi:transposase